MKKLINEIESNSIKGPIELMKIRPDADKVHSDSFYFFDLKAHRTMILLVFDDDVATVLWAGDHRKYESTFKNNKSTIKKWLKSKNLIK